MGFFWWEHDFVLWTMVVVFHPSPLAKSGWSRMTQHCNWSGLQQLLLNSALWHEEHVLTPFHDNFLIYKVWVTTLLCILVVIDETCKVRVHSKGWRDPDLDSGSACIFKNVWLEINLSRAAPIPYWVSKSLPELVLRVQTWLISSSSPYNHGPMWTSLDYTWGSSSDEFNSQRNTFLSPMPTS